MSLRRPDASMSMGRTVALVVAAGLLFGFAHPFVIPTMGEAPIDASGMSGLLALVCLVPLFVAVRGQAPGRAFLLALAAHAIGLYVSMHWWGVALAQFGGWPWPVAVAAPAIGITVLLAPIPALAFVLAPVLTRRLRLPSSIAFALTYGALEWTRNYVPSGGVPWTNLGTALAPIHELRQGAAIAGVYGLVMFAAFVNASLAAAIPTRQGIIDRAQGRGTALHAAAALAIVVVAWAYGAQRTAPTGGAVLQIGVLQPSLSQDVLNDEPRSTPTVQAAYRALQQEAIRGGARLVVWPEAALRPMVDVDAKDLAAQGALAAGEAAPAAALVGALTTSTALIDGGLRVERRVHTSAVATSPGFAVVGRFDKTRLVPFGEFVPWWAAPFAGKVTTGAQVTPGAGWTPMTLVIDDVPVKIGATICFEGIFPEISRAFAAGGAQVLLNLTNDAWYGKSSAAWQHMWFSSLRAVETGRPLVRAGNVGISAWFDPLGDVHDATTLFARAAPVFAVPMATIDTPYLILGDALPAAAALLVLIALIVAMIGRRG